MKDVIVLCVILPFTLALLCLIGYTEHNFQNENCVRETVYYGEQQASKDGCFTVSNVEDIKENIAKDLSIEKDEIKITSDNTIKYRPEVINYKVEVPIEKVVPANKMFGISDKQNRGKIVVESKVMSERLTP